MGGVRQEVIPGVTGADIDEMADLVFGRVDKNHPDSDDSDSIIRILNEGSELADRSPAFLRKAAL
jgi:hypothetical protein